MRSPMFLICFVILLAACKKNSTSPCGLNTCMQTQIEEFKSSVICKSGAAVKEYSFQEKTVYVFDQTNCVDDGAAGVYDANCNYLGMLGGIAGFGKINSVAFYENATYVRTIWQN